MSTWPAGGPRPDIVIYEEIAFDEEAVDRPRLRDLMATDGHWTETVTRWPSTQLTQAEYEQVLIMLGVLEDWPVVRERVERAAKIPERPVHWPWLHGPADE